MAASKRRRAVFALACAAPLLAACNAILGISDYSKDDCSGGGSECLGVREDSGVDANTDGGRDAGNDVLFIDATGTAPVSWIQFPMPNYEQVGVPEASYPIYAQQAAADGGGIVDTVSKLVWRKVEAGENEDRSYALAETFCKDRPGANWRLPTRIELVSLLDMRQKPTANAIFGLESQVYWTSSPFRGLAGTVVTVTNQRWVVSFAGNVDVLDTREITASARVICIQGL